MSTEGTQSLIRQLDLNTSCCFFILFSFLQFYLQEPQTRRVIVNRLCSCSLSPPCATSWTDPLTGPLLSRRGGAAHFPPLQVLTPRPELLHLYVFLSKCGSKKRTNNNKNTKKALSEKKYPKKNPGLTSFGISSEWSETFCFSKSACIELFWAPGLFYMFSIIFF